VGLSNRVVSGPAGHVVRVWAAECDRPTDFSSIASISPGIGFVRVGGTTSVHLRGPATQASTLSCPADAEYFGVDFRLGAIRDLKQRPGADTARASTSAAATCIRWAAAPRSARSYSRTTWT
jgi:hypothetical protein